MTSGDAMLTAFVSEDDLPLSRYYITSTIACIVARYTVRILIKSILFYRVEPSRSIRLHAQKKRCTLKLESYTYVQLSIFKVHFLLIETNIMYFSRFRKFHFG